MASECHGKVKIVKKAIEDCLADGFASYHEVSDWLKIILLANVCLRSRHSDLGSSSFLSV